MIDNPAARLHAVLTAMRREDGNQQLGTAWSNVLGVRREDPPRMMRAVASVLELGPAAEAALLAMADEPHELLLEWRAPVTSAFAIAHQYEKALSSFTGRYSDASLLSLNFSADALRRRGGTWPTIELDKMDAARSLVTELLAVLRDSDLDADAKALLLRHATALQSALELVEVVGADGIRDAMAGAVGALYMVSLQHPKARKHPVADKFFVVLGRLADIVTIAGVPLALTPSVDAVAKLITSG